MSKRKIPYPVTDAEDAAIRKAAASDPDAPELTDAELAEFTPAGEVLSRILRNDKAEAMMRRIRAGHPLSGGDKLTRDADFRAVHKMGAYLDSE